MADPIETTAPDDSGSGTLERFVYQVHAALRPVIQMLAGGPVLHVTCEHIEDIVVANKALTDPESGVAWDFQQVKTRDAVEPWSLTDLIASKALKSLWRTEKTLQESSSRDINYRLTACLEGYLDPGDENLKELSRGEGGNRPECVKRVARHLSISEEEAALFLKRIQVRQLPRRDDIEVRNISALSELGDQLTNKETKALYDELCRRTQLAMQGKLGQRWPLLVTTPDASDRVDRKRVTNLSLSDIKQRLIRPDHILLQDITQDLQGLQTSLVRKLRTGLAARETIEDAQYLRAQADSHRLSEQALGTWPANTDIERDLDRRLILTARRIVIQLRSETPSPANAIFSELHKTFSSDAQSIDRVPLYARDTFLLVGRACALSDECHFNWGGTDE
ncbi:dsDNA nuclease domain-containing protein [Lentzea kentuckyensis]|uniref:dsDNA nuclease domain-containing protein n=1 Tax=Lentzea kentuckyensis TaxID=360086 RepID=UPI000A387EE2|nr:dsDNA nuclease domain-containing protein [Lentzea kentuckyensis]